MKPSKGGYKMQQIDQLLVGPEAAGMGKTADHEAADRKMGWQDAGGHGEQQHASQSPGS